MAQSNRSGQFSLQSMFVFTTAAAVTLAVIMLPLQFGVKIILIQVVLFCVYYWAVGHDKQASAGSRDFLGISVTGLPIGYAVWYYSQSTARHHIPAYVVAAMVLVWVAFVISKTIALCRVGRREDRLDDETA